MLALFSHFWHCSKLSWEMKQELRKRQGARTGLMLTLALPGSTTLRYGTGAIAAPGLGQFDARLLDVSTLTRSAIDRTGRIESVEQDVTIDDISLAFVSVVDGPRGHLVRGSTFRLTLGSPNVPRAQWFTAWAGAIDAYAMVGPNRWKLTLRPQDLPLRKACPKPVITAADWPNADPAVYAQYGPLLYGFHNSGGTTGKGAVPLIRVDTVAFRYLLCWGRARTVDKIFVDGVDTPSGWSVSYPEAGGRVCTVVTFTADQGTKAITADCSGYEKVGDGTGALVSVPTDVIRHFLTNFVFGDFKTGNWLPESTLIDAATFNATAAFFARSSARSSKRIFGAQRLGMDWLNEWSQTWQTRLFWTNAGTIGCRAEEYASLALYRDDQTGWIRSDDTPFDPDYRPGWEDLVDRVNVDYHYQEAAGKYLYSLEVRDPSLSFEAPESLQLPWSSAIVVSSGEKGYAFYGSRRLRLRRLPGGIIEALVPTLEFMDSELLDLMAVSHPNLPSADGRGAGVKSWARWPVLKLRSEVDFAVNSERMLLRDLRTYLCRHWDIAKPQRVATNDGEGLARLDVGTTRTYTRVGAAWVYRVDRRVVALSQNAEKHDFDGDLFESQSTQLLLQSSFRNSSAGLFTGWTHAGEGSNGSDIAIDTTDNLFASLADGSGQSCKFIAGNPSMAGSLTVSQQITAGFTGGGTFSIWHKDDSGYALRWAIRRESDSFWWDDSTGGWTDTQIFNPLTVRSVPAMDQSGAGPLAVQVASGTAYTFFIGLTAAAAVAGQVNHAYHAQFEQGEIATSIIITEGATATRNADKLIITNEAIARSWPEDRGTFRCKVRPWWRSGGLPAAADKTIAFAQLDGENSFWLYYDKTTNAFRFEYQAQNTVYAATKAMTVDRGTVYNVACRWTSTAGELGLPAYSIDIWVWPDDGDPTGAKGTGATAAAMSQKAIVWAVNPVLEIGSRLGIRNFDGNIWAQEVVQLALPDSAVTRY